MPSEPSGWSGASASAKGDDRLVVPFFLGNQLVTIADRKYLFYRLSIHKCFPRGNIIS